MGQVVFIGFGNGSSGSGGSSSPLVYSVFGRDGTIASLFGDYSASLIANDSDVDGASVAAALDALAAETLAKPVLGTSDPLPVGSINDDGASTTAAKSDHQHRGVASFAGRFGAVVGALNDYAASLVGQDTGLSNLGTTVKDALTWLNGQVSSASSALSNKVDRTQQIVAGAGLSGGGALGSGNVSLAAAVQSVFNRSGAVIATLGDYAASQISNDSGVLGGTYANLATLLAYLNTQISGKANTAVQVIAGTGLTGGGTLAADRTINVAAADGSIAVSADAIAVGVVSDAQHGERGVGTTGNPLHALATTGAPGFMSPAHVTKVDAVRSYTANITSGQISSGSGVVAVSHNLNTAYPVVQVYGDDGILLGDNDVLIQLTSLNALSISFLSGSPENFASSADARVVVMKPYA